MQKKINDKQQKISDRLSHFRDFEIKFQTKTDEIIAREFENIKKIKIDELSIEFTDILLDLEFFDLVFAALLSGSLASLFDLNFFGDNHSKAL